MTVFCYYRMRYWFKSSFHKIESFFSRFFLKVKPIQDDGMCISISYVVNKITGFECVELSKILCIHIQGYFKIERQFNGYYYVRDWNWKLPWKALCSMYKIRSRRRMEKCPRLTYVCFSRGIIDMLLLRQWNNLFLTRVSKPIWYENNDFSHWRFRTFLKLNSHEYKIPSILILSM